MHDAFMRWNRNYSIAWIVYTVATSIVYVNRAGISCEQNLFFVSIGVSVAWFMGADNVLWHSFIK